MFLVYIVYHLFAIDKLLRKKVHRIPQVVATPILPILDNAVKRHIQCTVLVDDAFRFLGTLVALLTLPESISPQWEHGHIARQMTNLGDDTIGRTTVHEVIVNTFSYL